ncbi:MAG TPA: hypothetical protein VIL71_23075 [Spirillospora sp.]
MVVVDVVLEACDAVGFEGWPVGELPEDGFLVLSGRMSSVDVGTAMAVICAYNGIACAGGLTEAGLERRLAESGAWVAPGGLRFRDADAGVGIAPGCCFGLENWRDWWDVVRGQVPWLGHDPTPRVTHVGSVVRLQQDEGESPSIELSRDDLSGLLASAQEDLSGFQRCVREWAAVTAPEVAERLVSVLDESFVISGVETRS